MIALLWSERVDVPNGLAVGGLVLFIAKHAEQRVLLDALAESSGGTAPCRRLRRQAWRSAAMGGLDRDDEAFVEGTCITHAHAHVHAHVHAHAHAQCTH